MAEPKQSIWRSLGQMVGNIAAGIAADPKNPPARLRDDPQAAGSSPGAPPAWPGTNASTPADQPTPQVVSARVQEQVVQTPEGPVRLRRTVIDEVVPPVPGRVAPGAAGASGVSPRP